MLYALTDTKFLFGLLFSCKLSRWPESLAGENTANYIVAMVDYGSWIVYAHVRTCKINYVRTYVRVFAATKTCMRVSSKVIQIVTAKPQQPANSFTSGLP